ncbi:hypothetical protein KCX82_19410 [Clostridiales bacterium BAD-6]|uniref:Uncharacterized protein n=1 Tax=Sinanaerobacter chloroacetimidivorans TaxID=2818044 RepID=A0A8J7W375_9FIRM|nr:hypothetical protein [Sinanaerobacter chloroacetimidivorans]
MFIMNVRRTVATTVLFVLIFTLSSPLLSVAAASFSKGTDPCNKCCSTESNRAEKESIPISSEQCSLPCCPVLFCIPVFAPQPNTYPIILDKVNIINLVEHFNIETLLHYVFKPPKKF